VGGTEINAPCSAFPTKLSGSTSPICTDMNTATLPQYGLRATSVSTSLHCLDPRLATSESAVSIGGSQYTSGGGFSRYFTRSNYATWQDSVVNSYLSSGGMTPSAALFNRSGRAIPDVAMYGGEFPIVMASTFSIGAGTSLSAPLFAAVIGILNQQTLAAKKATIGFANPLLYAMAASSPRTFTDITTGDNVCPAAQTITNITCPSSCQGYAAVRGWDPVTGLGVPNVGVMQSTLAQLLIYAQGEQTGSVTGITGGTGAATSVVSRSVWLSLLLVVVGSVLTLLVL